MKSLLFEKMISIYCYVSRMIFIISTLASLNVMADDIPINLSGTVHIPSCIVNNGSIIDISFGDISVSDVSNLRNHKTVSIPVKCEYKQGTAYVKITGRQLGANTNVLATNVPYFGIALYQGKDTTTKLELGEGRASEIGSIGYPVTAGISPQGGSFIFTFTAVPFKEGSSALSAGKFIASANIQITYL